MRSRPVEFRHLLWVAQALLLALLPRTPAAAEPVRARVAVVVDTSVSMRQAGMDPERTSLLVTQLLADLVPGELAAIRLLDLVADGALLPSRDTGQTMPCGEDPNQQCKVVEPDGDWEALARTRQLGLLRRPARGERAFKEALVGHLEQRSNNSGFEFAFRAAQGFLDAASAAEPVPRLLVWLSDGRTDDPAALQRAVNDLEVEGVRIEAVVFGQGDPSLARDLDLKALQVTSPAALMAAFADIFRQIVQAPFRIDHTLAQTPVFAMKPNVEEAWVVVYGDESLTAATLDGPGGEVAADYAIGTRRGAGAYRVAHLRRPASGAWRVAAQGGGRGVAYAVIQRSDLRPALLAPQGAVSGVETLVVAALHSGLNGDLRVGESGKEAWITDAEVLAGASITLTFEDQTLVLRDDGSGGDEVAKDGRFSALGRFRGPGPVSVTLALDSSLAQRSVDGEVQVSGVFRHVGGPLEVDLGNLRGGEEVCRRLTLPVERVGEVPLELLALRPVPTDFSLWLRLAAGRLPPGGRALPSPAEEVLELCLRADRRAAAFTAVAEPWLKLRLAGSEVAEHSLPLILRFQVHPLSFWELWGRLILVVLGLLVVAFLVLGFLWPHRFQRALALAMAPELEDLAEQSAQPIVQWKGVGIGFYRHARAFLQADYRLTGKGRGALASLRAAKRATLVYPGIGRSLFRETLDGAWEAVDPQGRRARAGDVYRVGEGGPYFRIAVQGGRR